MLGNLHKYRFLIHNVKRYWKRNISLPVMVGELNVVVVTVGPEILAQVRYDEYA